VWGEEKERSKLGENEGGGIQSPIHKGEIPHARSKKCASHWGKMQLGQAANGRVSRLPTLRKE